MNNTDHYLDVLGQINLDDLHIQQAFNYYEEQYEKSELAQQFVQASCLIADEFKEHSLIGFCDRTMGRNIPKRKSQEGAAIRGSLQRSGLVRASGHELFRGCIVFSTHDINGCVLSAVGYRVGRIREGDKPIVYWQKPDPRAFVDTGMRLAKELINAKALH